MQKIKIDPIQDCVIIRRDTAAEKAGLIHIPEVLQQAPVHGRVIAVGPGRVLPDGSVRPVAVQPGDRVLFERHMGTEVESEGGPVLVLREKHLVGILDDTSRVEFVIPPPPPRDVASPEIL